MTGGRAPVWAGEVADGWWVIPAEADTFFALASHPMAKGSIAL